MIAEPGVLSTSPWNCDLSIKDYPPYFNTNDANEFEFPVIDIDSRSIRGDLKPDFNSSCSPSSNSSECSDEFNFDTMFPNLLDSDNTAGFSGGSFGSYWTDNLSLSNSFLIDDTGIEETPSAHMLSPPKQKQSKSIDPLMDNNSWSSMHLNEQLEAVENLTQIISAKMGLREQLDIIRIIEPNAVISPTDTEFVIDLSALNDVKLSGVKEYVKKVLASQEESNHKKSAGKSGSSSASSKCNSSTSTSGKNTTVTSPAKSKSVKKKELKEKRATQKAYRQRQKKEQRQRAKESRSGLFAQEEILALSTCPVVEDDTDIDILG